MKRPGKKGKKRNRETKSERKKKDLSELPNMDNQKRRKNKTNSLFSRKKYESSYHKVRVVLNFYLDQSFPFELILLKCVVMI